MRYKSIDISEDSRKRDAPDSKRVPMQGDNKWLSDNAVTAKVGD